MSRELIRRALTDPAFHRERFYERPLSWPQVEAIRLIEKHLDSKSGKILTIRSARQTGKNEVSATVEERFLLRYQRCGGTIVKSAPTYKPQIVNSKRRLDQMMRADPFFGKSGGYREGYIKQVGKASVEFLSADKSSNVEGATASCLLEIDEAHKTDKGKFEEAFAPMTASTGAACVMYGVAAAKADLLYEQRTFNEAYDPSLNLQFPASVWCEINPAYARHYEERRKKLGPDHPVILTQYDLVDIEAIGGYLSRWQRQSLLASDHQRQITRGDADSQILVTIDIAGQDEDGEDLSLEKGESTRDQTVALIWSIDWSRAQNEIPLVRLLDLYWWVGAPLAEGKSKLPGQQEQLLKLIQAWRADKVVVDARGVGEQIAAFLAARHGAVEQYKADQESVSKDCYSLLGFINNDQVKIFRNDESQDYQELTKQLEHTAREIKNHDKMKIVKPAGSQTKHIDMVKAMTYLRHGIAPNWVYEIY